MNTVEIRKAALSAAIEKTNMPEIATQIGDASFIVPVEVEGATRYVEFKATVKNKDNKEGIELLDIDLPFNFIAPKQGDIVVDGKKKFISYMQSLVLQLRAKYGVFGKMVMSRATFKL